MLLRELHIDLTAPGLCFEAESAEECFVALKAWRQNLGASENPTLYSAIKTICHGDAAQLHMFTYTSVLNMFTIASGRPRISFQQFCVVWSMSITQQTD